MQRETVKLGIVIPTINMSEYVKELIHTINTSYSYHVFLIDNDSDEDHARELQILGEREYIDYKRNLGNIGCAASWNQGIGYLQRSKNCTHVAVLNNDILLHPDCLDKMIEISLENEIPLVSGLDICKECSNPWEALEKELPKEHYLIENPDFSCFVMDLQFFDWMAEQEADVEEFPGRFDAQFYPAYYEDNDFHYRINLAGRKAVCSNQAMFYHYGSRTILENKEVGAVSNSYYLVNGQRFLDKWGGKPGEEKNKKPFDSIGL